MLKESVLPSRRLRTWILHLVRPQTLTLFIKAIIISREVNPVCLRRAADLQQSSLCLKTEALCGLTQQGFNRRIGIYFLICYKVSIYIISSPVVFNDLQDIRVPIIPGCAITSFLLCRFFPGQCDEDLTSSFQTASVSSLCGWWSCQRDSVWPEWWDETGVMICLSWSHLQLLTKSERVCVCVCLRACVRACACVWLMCV